MPRHHSTLAILLVVAASLQAAPIPEDMIKAFKAIEGAHLGTSSYPMGKMKVEAHLGSLAGVFETEGEAIQAARVSPGTEVLKRKKAKDGRFYYAIFSIDEFDGVGRSMNTDPNAGRFAVVERDTGAEQRFTATGDVRLALFEVNELTKSDWHQPGLRRYESDEPERQNLVDLPLNLEGIPAQKLAEAREWIAARKAEREQQAAGANAAHKAEEQQQAGASAKAR